MKKLKKKDSKKNYKDNKNIMKRKRKNMSKSI